MDLEMKNKLIGNYFKKEREYHDLKLSQVSKDINIPKTSLWEYERGLKNFESEKVNIFNLYYDTTFDCNELYYEESLQTLLAAYFYYSKFNIDKINNLYEESCRYIDTLGYSSYYLIRLIWKLVNEKMDDRDIDEMDNIKFLLSNKQKVIYYEIICGYYIKINNIKLARKYLSYIENYDDFDFLVC